MTTGNSGTSWGAVSADYLCGPENGGHAYSSHLGPGIPRWVTVDICLKCDRIEVNMSMLREKVEALGLEHYHAMGYNAAVTDILALLDSGKPDYSEPTPSGKPADTYKAGLRQKVVALRDLELARDFGGADNVASVASAARVTTLIDVLELIDGESG